MDVAISRDCNGNQTLPEDYLIVKTKKALKWAISHDGRKDIGAVIATVTALYTALHRAGVL